MMIEGLKTFTARKNDIRFHIANEILKKIGPILNEYEDLMVFNTLTQISAKIALLNGLNLNQFKEFAEVSYEVAQRDLKAKLDSLDKKGEQD